jgi:hypothetical protein
MPGLGEGDIIPGGIGSMAQLTRLRLEREGFKLSSAAFQPILGLPSLESLYIDIDDRSKEPTALRLQSRRLTSLTLQFAQFGRATSVPPPPPPHPHPNKIL